MTLAEMALENNYDDFVNLKSILLLLFVFLLATWWMQKPRNLPPGPWSFPFVGFVPQLIWYIGYKKELMHNLATRLGRKYGNICSFDIFGHVVVVITDFATIKEAFNHPALSDKGFNNEFEQKMFGSHMHSYKYMAEHRKFALHTLRGFGIGKSSFETNIATESTTLMDEVGALKGKPCNPHNLFISCVTNVLYSILFGKRHDYEDADFHRLTDQNSRIMHLFGEGAWTLMTPKYYPNKSTKEILRLVQDINTFIAERIKEHRVDYDGDNIRDFIDAYLQAIERATKTDDPFSHLQEDNMTGALFLLFLTGADTTTVTLDWCCLYMMAYLDVQKKIQEEMDAVVGRNRLPQLADQNDLPYTRSALLEIQRHFTLAPLSVFHTSSADVSLQGFTIPKGSTVVTNIGDVMRNPKSIPEPERFNPERFVDENGKHFEIEEMCHFGVGRRICLGESVAKMEVYILFTHLLHRFSLVKPEDAQPITFEGIYGTTYAPKPFQVKFVPRD